jgi:hypothetical protein
MYTFPHRATIRHSSHVGPVARRSVPSLSSVLGYLQLMQQYAESARDRDTAREYESARLFALRFTHGPLPVRQPSPTAQGYAVALPRQGIPKWKARVLAKPMRKVVSRREVEGARFASGWAPSLVLLTLSCGHVVEELAFMLGDKPAFRRRCGECH